jgi:hypothetical protein
MMQSVFAVAQVKNELDGCWWEFNDEEVKSLGLQPSGYAEAAKGEPPRNYFLDLR